MVSRLLLASSLLIWISFSYPAPAARAVMTSPSYRVEADVLNFGGGEGQSPSWMTFGSLGDAAAGLSVSANYVADAGLPAQLVNTALSIAVDAGTASLGSITPGTPLDATTTIYVATDAANGYSLAAQYSGAMSSGSNTIVDFGGSIATPVIWSSNCVADPAQCGFGFTVSDGTTVEAKWAGGSKFAAFTTAAAEIHAKPGFQPLADSTAVKYRADVPTTQASGAYTTTVTYTATAAL